MKIKRTKEITTDIEFNELLFSVKENMFSMIVMVGGSRVQGTALFAELTNNMPKAEKKIVADFLKSARNLCLFSATGDVLTDNEDKE